MWLFTSINDTSVLHVYTYIHDTVTCAAHTFTAVHNELLTIIYHKWFMTHAFCKTYYKELSWKLLYRHARLELIVGWLFWTIKHANNWLVTSNCHFNDSSLSCMPDEARDAQNVALKWQLEVTSHLLASSIIQNTWSSYYYYTELSSMNWQWCRVPSLITAEAAAAAVWRLNVEVYSV